MKEESKKGIRKEKKDERTKEEGIMRRYRSKRKHIYEE